MEKITFRTEKYKGTPLYQNNPGQIGRSSTDWYGKVPSAQRIGNSGKEEFEYVEYGIRAIMRSIRTLMVGTKNNTIDLFARHYKTAVNRFKVNDYIKELCLALNVKESDRITKFDRDFFVRMAQAIVKVEVGALRHDIPLSSYEYAYSILDVDKVGATNSTVPSKKVDQPINDPNRGGSQKVDYSKNNMLRTDNGNNASSHNNTTRKTTNKPTVNNHGAINNNVTPNNTNAGNNNTTNNSFSNSATDNYPGTKANPYPTGNKSNIFLWIGLAVAGIAGGYLVYDNFIASPKKGRATNTKK